MIDNISVDLNGSDAKCRSKVNDLVQGWCNLPYMSFNKVLNWKGTRGPSQLRAKGLVSGCDWDRDLTDAMIPALKLWKKRRIAMHDSLANELPSYLTKIYARITREVEQSKVEVYAISTAKELWEPRKMMLLSIS
jgi:hypothetical protein